MAWGCPECDSEHLEQLSYRVLVDREMGEPNINQDGTAGEVPRNLKQDRFISFEAFVERYCEAECSPPELRCQDCGAEFDQAVRI